MDRYAGECAKAGEWAQTRGMVVVHTCIMYRLLVLLRLLGLAALAGLVQTHNNLASVDVSAVETGNGGLGGLRGLEANDAEALGATTAVDDGAEYVCEEHVAVGTGHLLEVAPAAGPGEVGNEDGGVGLCDDASRLRLGRGGCRGGGRGGGARRGRDVLSRRGRGSERPSGAGSREARAGRRAILLTRNAVWLRVNASTNVATIGIVAVQYGNGLIGLIRGAELDNTNATGATIIILEDFHIADLADSLTSKLLEILPVHLEREVADKNATARIKFGLGRSRVFSSDSDGHLKNTEAEKQKERELM